MGYFNFLRCLFSVKFESCSFIAVVFIFVVFAILISLDCDAAPMDLQYFGSTVSGVKGIVGTTNGKAGVSLLMSPYALCFGLTDEDIIIGDNSYFRVVSRKNNITSTLFGQVLPGTTDGEWKNAAVDHPLGCTRGMSHGEMTVYFVEGKGAIRYFTKDKVFTLYFLSFSFTDVYFYQNTLYITEQYYNNVWKCFINDDGTPTECAAEPQISCRYNKFKAIAVTNEGVFVVATDSRSSGICWYDEKSGDSDILDGDFVDIYALNSGLLYAITAEEIYSITIKANKLSATRIVGNSAAVSSLCNDGLNPLLCKNRRLFIIAKNEMYVSTGYFTVRSITLPPVVVGSIITLPLPVHFPDEDAILPTVVKKIEVILNKALNTKDTVIDENSITVNKDTWNTEFSVLVQQENFDNVTTKEKIKDIVYEDVIDFMGNYYDKTNYIIYLDTNIVPFCNSTFVNILEHKLVAEVRKKLNFLDIYSYQIIPYFGAVNISMLKLLMSEKFNNDTTRENLEAIDFQSIILDYLNETYGPKNNLKLIFPGNEYNFSFLISGQENDVRWLVRDTISQQLKACESDFTDTVEVDTTKDTNNDDEQGSTSGSNSGDRVSDSSPCDVIITNRTMRYNPTPPFMEESVYDIFVPDIYKFNVSSCIQGADWTELKEFLWTEGTTSPSPSFSPSSTCDRWCIIVIAVVAAALLTALIAAAVVLTSKRRRLAAVVAPSRPDFKSTFEETLQDDEEEISSKNPLSMSAGVERQTVHY